MPRALKVKVTYKDHGLERIVKKLGDVGAKSVNVGVVGPKAEEPAGRGDITNGENAIIQFYGTKNIPPRKFLTEPFNTHRGEVVKGLSQVVRDVIGGGGQTVAHLGGGTGAGAARMFRAIVDGVSVDVALDRFGEKMVKIVQEDMLKPGGIGDPNAPATVEKKGFDHPLLETNGLVDAISHRIVRKEFGDALEAGAAIGDYESFVVGRGEEE